ncbi:MAG TPA: (2Fe-2S) ferredoxin domain-containing protein [Candidatus Magasanikbacteria bacterium]|nr:(2Fe-2S) ferredoxin domain-containing protein [Candidatus Magasanikbacteria bacterium]
MREHIQKIEVCCGGDCMVDGAHAVVSVLQEKYSGTQTKVSICGCIDQCEKAVNVIVDEKEIFSYSKPATIVQRLENTEGEAYTPFDSDKLNLSADFLGDL